MLSALKSTSDPAPYRPPREALGSAAQTSEEMEEWYVCRVCRHAITRPADQRRIQGRQVHIFANPSGIVYEFCCFVNAAGCALAGSESYEFTWFTGHRWRIAVCAACRNHLGWKFTADLNQGFFGLICDRLTLTSLPRQ